MATLPLGKLPPDLLTELIRGDNAPGSSEERTRPARDDVLLGPAVGEDGCALAVGGGVLVAATDPITMTGADVGAHAVTINANDIAVMGVAPQWFLANVLLPEGTSRAQTRALFASMHAALDKLGVALVGGHTEVTSSVVQPVVVGQMMGFSATGHFLRTSDMRAGDAIVQVGPAPVEAAAILLEELSEEQRRTVPQNVLADAARATTSPGISVVDPALVAANHGATVMHDPTEGGLAAGLWEMAHASSVRIDIDGGLVDWFEPGVALSKLLALDPWGVLASGCLLVGVPIADLDALSRALEPYGARTIGTARAGEGVYLDGHALPRFHRDELSRLHDASLPTDTP